MADIKLVMQAETAPVDRAVRLLDNLQAELRDVKRAQDSGLISTKRAANETKRLNDQIARLNNAARGSATDFRKFEKSVYGSGKAMRQKEIAMQQAGYQLQDFIVQVQAGTNPLIAFSQQGSQLAGFFAGPWGAAIGLGIAALGSLAMAFMSTMDSAADFDDQIKEVESTLGRLTELLSEQRRGFDDFFEIEEEKIKRLSQASKDLLAIAKIEAFDSIQGLNKSLVESVLGASYLKTELEDVADLIGATFGEKIAASMGGRRGKEINELYMALYKLAEAPTLQGQYDVAIKIRDIFKDNVDITGELTDQQKKFWKELSTTIQKMELLGATQKSTAALGYQEYGKSRAEGAMMMDVASAQQYADAMFAIQRAQAEIAQGRRGEAEFINSFADRLNDALLSRNKLELEYNKKLKEATKEYGKQKDSLADSIGLLKIAIKYGEDSKQYKVMERSQQEDINKQLDEAEEKRLKALGYSDTQVQTIIGLIQKQRGLNEELDEEEKKRKRILKLTEEAASAYSKSKVVGIKADVFDPRGEAGITAVEAMRAGVQVFDYGKGDDTKPPKGKTPSTIEDTIKAMEREMEAERKLIGLEGERRRAQELYQELLYANQDADIKTTETRLRNLANQKAAQEEYIRKLDEEKQRQEDLANSIGSSFETALMSIVDGTKSVEDAFRTMAIEVIKELYRVLVVQKMVNAAKMAFGFADGGVIHNGNVVPYASGGIVGGPTYFPMSGGRTGLMGEAGPEAIMPLKRGKGGKLGVEVSGDTKPTVIHQNFNFAANGDESVKRMIAQAAPQIAKMTEKGIMDSRRRGGQMKAVFG